MRPSDIGEYDLTLCHGPSKDITCRVFVQLAILLHDLTAKRTDTKRKERSFVSRHRFLMDVEVVQIHVKPCCIVVSTQDLASIGNLRCGFGFSRLQKHQANRTLEALDLDYNGVGKHGAIALANALKATLVIRKECSSFTVSLVTRSLASMLQGFRALCLGRPHVLMSVSRVWPVFCAVSE